MLNIQSESPYTDILDWPAGIMISRVLSAQPRRERRRTIADPLAPCVDDLVPQLPAAGCPARLHVPKQMNRACVIEVAVAPVHSNGTPP